MRRILMAAASVLAVLAPGIALAGPAAAVAGLPSDPAASGYIGFCDETGHNVTGGSVGTKPFVWKAVSSTAPPAQYQGHGQNVVLNAYQPRPQIPQGEYSGLSITAASFYQDKAHPAAQATYQDQSFAQFIQAFPSQVNGLYVLRLYYGKANYGLYNRTYPTTTIQVAGGRWHVVSGGTVDCNAAKAVSNEQLTGVITKKQFTPRTTPPAGQTTVGGSTGGKTTPITSAPSSVSASSTPGAKSGDGAGKSGTQPSTAAASQSSSGGGHGWVWFVVVPLIVLIALAVLIWRRRAAGPAQT